MLWAGFFCSEVKYSVDIPIISPSINPTNVAKNGSYFPIMK